MSEPIGTIWVCLCCLLAAESEGCHGQHEHAHEPWALIDSNETVRVTLGMLAEEHADDCPNRAMSATRLAECDCERDDFSPSSCDGCGSPLAGERQAYTLWDERPPYLTTWFERDRAHVALWNNESQQRLLIEWWDEAVAQAVEDGFLNPSDWHGSALAYWQELRSSNGPACEHPVSQRFYRESDMAPWCGACEEFLDTVTPA